MSAARVTDAGEGVDDGDVSDGVDGPKTVYSHATRQAAAKQLFTGGYPELHDIKYVIVFLASSKDPNTHEINWRCLDKPDDWAQIKWIRNDHSMTLEERVKALNIYPTGKDEEKQAYRTFARVELGCNDRTVEYFMDLVILCLLNEVATGKTVQKAYVECCRRFSESMRVGYTYPDAATGHRQEKATSAQMKEYEKGFQSRAFPNRVTLPINDQTATGVPYSVDIFAGATMPSQAAQENNSQSLSLLADADNSSPRRTAAQRKAFPEGPGLFSNPAFVPSMAHASKTAAAPKTAPAKKSPAKGAKGAKAPATPKKSPAKGKKAASSSQPSTSSGGAAGGAGAGGSGGGGGGGGGGGKKQPNPKPADDKKKQGKKRKGEKATSEEDTASDKSPKTPKKSPLKRAKKAPGKAKEPKEPAAGTSATPVEPSQEDLDAIPSTSAGATGILLANPKNKSRRVFTKCCPACICNQYDENTVPDSFNESVSSLERDHRIAIANNLAKEKQNSALRTIFNHIKHIGEDTTAIKGGQDEIEEYAKVAADHTQYKTQKAEDLELLGLKWKTYAQLNEALTKHKAVLVRACKYVDGDRKGDKFIQRYIEYLMEFSFHCRLYPKTTTTHKLADGRIMHLGVEYFIFPEDLADIMFEHCQENWGASDWSLKTFREKLYSVLDNDRRDYYSQLKNFFVREKDSHPLYNALWWDSKHNTDVFTEPAPIWESCTEKDRDDYWERHEDEFNSVVIERKNCPGYPQKHPHYNAATAGKRSYMLEEEATTEPRWGVQWGED